MWSELETALRGHAVAIHGATVGWAAWLAAEVAERDPLLVIVAADDATARQLEADVRLLRGRSHDPTSELDPIAVLPSIDVPPYADLSPDRAAIATGFITSIFIGTGRYDKIAAPTLAIAREEAAKLEAWCQNGRKAMVYAILPGGQQVLVPADYDRAA